MFYGATDDSSEHFWQAVKYHPAITVAQLAELLASFSGRIGSLGSLAWMMTRPCICPTLRGGIPASLSRARSLRWFRQELDRQGVHPSEHAREVQQRQGSPIRFNAFQGKVLWGDLADVFHLVYFLSSAEGPVRNVLEEHHFDGVIWAIVRWALSAKSSAR